MAEWGYLVHGCDRSLAKQHRVPRDVIRAKVASLVQKSLK